MTKTLLVTAFVLLATLQGIAQTNSHVKPFNGKIYSPQFGEATKMPYRALHPTKDKDVKIANTQAKATTPLPSANVAQGSIITGSIPDDWYFNPWNLLRGFIWLVVLVVLAIIYARQPMRTSRKVVKTTTAKP